MTTQQILTMKILQQTRLNLLGDKKSFEQSGPVRERIARMISSFEHGSAKSSSTVSFWRCSRFAPFRTQTRTVFTLQVR